MSNHTLTQENMPEAAYLENESLPYTLREWQMATGDLDGREAEDRFVPRSGDINADVHDRDTHIGYKSAMARVKGNIFNGYDPSDPCHTEAKKEKDRMRINDFQTMIRDEMEAAGLDVEYSEIKIYSALDTALDYWHGVDIVVEYRDVDVTLDMTTNPYKMIEGNYRADVVFHPLFDKSVEHAAKQVANKILERYVPQHEVEASPASDQAA